jgi:hypothetical protein
LAQKSFADLAKHTLDRQGVGEAGKGTGNGTSNGKSKGVGHSNRVLLPVQGEDPPNKPTFFGGDST